MAETALTKLKKTDYIPFLDTSGTGSTTPTWKRVTRSKTFSLNPSPQTESLEYIGFETPITEITRYQPELPLDVALNEGDPIYDFVFGLFYDLPIGSEAYVPALICFGGTGKKAWQIKQTTLTLGNLDTVVGTLSFTLNFGGDIERGTYTITAGAPAFTAASGEA